MSERRLFRALRSNDFDTPRPKPFWRQMTLTGWLFFITGIASTLSLPASLFFGMSWFLIPAGSGDILFSDLHETPWIFWGMVALNILVTVVFWVLFTGWLQEIREKKWGRP